MYEGYKEYKYTKECETCGKIIQTNRDSQRFCSTQCSRTKRKDKKRQFIQASMREYILEKFNFTCQECGFRPLGIVLTNNLHIHHIKPLYKGGKDMEENIILLCKNCHLKIHKEVICQQKEIEL